MSRLSFAKQHERYKNADIQCTRKATAVVKRAAQKLMAASCVIHHQADGDDEEGKRKEGRPGI